MAKVSGSDLEVNVELKVDNLGLLPEEVEVHFNEKLFSKNICRITVIWLVLPIRRYYCGDSAVSQCLFCN